MKTNDDKLYFWAFYFGSPGLTQKLKVPKLSVDRPSPVFVTAPPFFSIFGPARGQLFEKKVQTINNTSMFFCLFWAFYIRIPLQGAFRRPNPGFWRLQAPETRILKIHGPKVKSSNFFPPITPRQCLSRPTLFAIFGRASGQIYGKNRKKTMDFLHFWGLLYRKSYGLVSTS